MEWFRCYSEFSTDSKVQIMPEHMQRRLIMLFCLRSCDALATLHETEIAFALRITEQELLETKELFIQKEFIDDEWNVLSWDKRQYISDTSTERSRKHRLKKKEAAQQACNVAATPPEQNRTEQIQNRTEQNRTERGTHTDFKDLIFSKEFLEISTECNLDPEMGERSFNVWKVKRRLKPPKDIIGDFGMWCLKEKEKKPTGKESLTVDKLTGEDAKIQKLGSLAWKRKTGMHLNAAQDSFLEGYENDNGEVWWKGTEDYKKGRKGL